MSKIAQHIRLNIITLRAMLKGLFTFAYVKVPVSGVEYRGEPGCGCGGNCGC